MAAFAREVGMSVTADQLRELMALGFEGEKLLAIVAVFDRDASRSVTVASRDASRSVSKDAERSRRYRERKRDDRHGRVTVASRSTEMHIGTSTSREETKESKKVRKKTISALFDVPDDASEENRTFAESKGWNRQRTDSEWQRFRDYSINKGKKHRNVAAAWRNWVTSPYQGAQNGQEDRKSALAVTDRILDRFEDLDTAYVPGSGKPAPLRLDLAPVPTNPKRLPAR
jgi:hypothetical protein